MFKRGFKPLFYTFIGKPKKYKMTEHEEFKEYLKDLGISQKDLAEITGISYETIRSALSKGRPFPKWLRLVLHLKKLDK